jgi:hypothetical protein
MLFRAIDAKGFSEDAVTRPPRRLFFDLGGCTGGRGSLSEYREERRERMEQALPVEELAKQRLNVLVQAYSLFTKNLMEEGLDREKVKRASDRVWSILGDQVGQQMKTLLGQTEKGAALQAAGAMAESVHGIEVKREAEEKGLRTEFVKCPWAEAVEALEMPKEWRLCPSGHAAFAEHMFKTMYPDSSFELSKSMPMGDKICEGKTSF